MASDIRNKIQKLLDLSQSPNEHEAKAAMLKAKELMMKHNLTQMEIEGFDPSSKNVISYRTDIVCSKNVEPWIIDLAGVIAKNYRCEDYMLHKKGARQRTIAFFGFEEDVEICGIMFKYALQCIWNKFPEIRDAMRPYGYGVKECRPLTDSYARGFIKGMEEAFRSQLASNESEWGLVAVVPTEVIEYSRSQITGTVDMHSKSNRIVSSMYRDGVEDGKKWTPNEKISTTELAN